MNKSLITTAIAIFGSAAASTASASVISATITADNHYALYTSSGGITSLIGGNEIGAAGSPGTYNWSLPETHTFDTPDTIYIAVWSDDRVAQGLLAELNLGGGLYLRTGDARWEVYPTGINLGDMSPYPTVSEIDTHVAHADSNSLWQAPHAGAINHASTGPWSMIPGISSETRWTWGNPAGASDPLRGGANHDELQIFRVVVPNPGSVTITAVAGLILVRRRRLN